MLEKPTFKSDMIAIQMITALQNESPEDAIHGVIRCLGHLIMFHSSHGYLSDRQARVMWPEIRGDIENFTLEQYKKWEEKNLN